MQSFVYDDAIVRMFTLATLVFGLVAFLVGLIVAVQLAWPQANFVQYVNFGRLRPLHTNAAIFAFAGNAIFAAVYYSTQRLCKARMFSDVLSRIHFWGWQLIIVAAAVTLPLGITTSKEYAELEWPIDIAIAAVWVVFAINFFGTLAVRRVRHMYVALWFYIATIVTVAILHIVNSLAIPVSLTKSYSLYAGVQDAFVQWWYGHNAVAFFLTTPFLGLMYYFLPKAAERPVFSYRLSIIHFWSLVFIYIWAGPHHLHYLSIPGWLSTLGMLFSLMLWMPSWGGMINGLLTLRGAWHKVTADPVLKFFVVGITFYGMSTFEGPMLSIKTVNSLSHYTDWTIAHVHGGALGWNGFMTFGMIYWLLPRLFQTQLYSRKLAEWHFWLGTIGIVMYISSIYVAGITQGLMWRAFDSTGQLMYPEFIETVTRLIPFYWFRVVGGLLFIAGALLCAYNFFRTWAARPARYEEPVHQAPALSATYVDPPRPEPRVKNVTGWARGIDNWQQGWWHRRWERLPLRFTVWTAIAVLVASAFEMVPTFLIRSNVPTIATVTPYTPLELCGRDIYIREGCYNCHSQQIRPIFAETKRYGEYSKPGEFVYDHPFQWGSRRIGPDLAREGGIRNHLWHLTHFRNPQAYSSGSIMPGYAFLLENQLDYASVQPRVNAMAMIGVPYGEAVKGKAADMAREQAVKIAGEVLDQGSPPEEMAPPELVDKLKKDGVATLTPDEKAKLVATMKDREVIALIAYLQRLGTDISKPPPAAPAGEAKTAAAAGH
ncbi:MAG: bifunctional cbb3-type cytochrome C oxidase subunit I/II [Planctomycetota bacterium]